MKFQHRLAALFLLLYRVDVGSPESAVWPCNVGLERLMKTVSIAESPPMGEEKLLKPPSYRVTPVTKSGP